MVLEYRSMLEARKSSMVATCVSIVPLPRIPVQNQRLEFYICHLHAHEATATARGQIK